MINIKVKEIEQEIGTLKSLLIDYEKNYTMLFKELGDASFYWTEDGHAKKFFNGLKYEEEGQTSLYQSLSDLYQTYEYLYKKYRRIGDKINVRSLCLVKLCQYGGDILGIKHSDPSFRRSGIAQAVGRIIADGGGEHHIALHRRFGDGRKITVKEIEGIGIIRQEILYFVQADENSLFARILGDGVQRRLQRLGIFLLHAQIMDLLAVITQHLPPMGGIDKCGNPWYCLPKNRQGDII